MIALSKLALSEAVLRAGGQARLGLLIGRSQGAISRWISKKGKCIPAECVLVTERFTGVPRHRLRPDLYSEDFIAPAYALTAPEVPSQSDSPQNGTITTSSNVAGAATE